MYRKIQINALLHQIKFGSSSAETVDLSPTRNSGFDMMSERIFPNQPPIFVIVDYRMWTRSDWRHFTAKNINELRQFIDTRSAHQTPDAGYPLVITLGLAMAVPFSTTVIVRNFQIMNSRPLKPMRHWRNITGPRESNLITKLTTASNGSSVTSPTPADAKSSARLVAISTLLSGACRGSVQWVPHPLARIRA
jgi:hypothetical protein